MPSWRARTARRRRGALGTALALVAGLVAAFGLSGCEAQICGANPILDALFCREDVSSTPVAVPAPELPPAKSPPNVIIDASAITVAIGESVFLDGRWSYDGTVDKVEWDLDGDGSYEVTRAPAAAETVDRQTVSYTTLGNHVVRLRVIYDRIIEAVEEQSILVQIREPIASLRILPAHPRVGQTVTFDASDSISLDTPITGYTWDIDGIPTNNYERTSGPVITRAYDSDRTINVGVRALTGQGGIYGEVRQVITIGNPPPTPTPLGPTSTGPMRTGGLHAVLTVSPNPAAFEEEVTLDGSRSTGAIASYEWDLDGNGSFELRTPTQSSVKQVFYTLGPLTVRLRVSDAHGRSDVATAQLTVVRHHGVRLPATASARGFTASLKTSPVRTHRGLLDRRGAVTSLLDSRVTGTFNGRIARAARASSADVLLGRLLRSSFRARVDASVNARKRTATTTMLVLATLPRASLRESFALACVRLTITRHGKQTPKGTFRVLGGTADAATLFAQGTFTYKPGQRTTSTLAGKVNGRLVGARRLTRACAALASP
jgi:PKD repeat protein